MKKQLIFLAFLLCCTVLAHAQKNHATNIKADVDEEKVTFNFDVLPDGQYRFFNICLKSFNAAITPKSTSGDIGKNKAAGTNKKLFWYYTNDGYTQDQITNLKMDVIAINPLEPRKTTAPPPKTIPIYAGLGTVCATGLGLAITGLTKNSDANETYDIYKNNLDPNSSVYSELGVTRDELYSDANSKHKNAQILMYGGAAVFAGAGYILINRIIWINRIKKQQNTSPSTPDAQCSIPQPRFELKPVDFGQTGIGLGLTYRF